MSASNVAFVNESANRSHHSLQWGANSIAGGNLVTGQNPASARGVAEKMITLLEAA